MNRKTLKGMFYWTTINGLFMWAVVGACLLGIPVAYNFMAWVTGVLCVVGVLGFLGMNMMKNQDPEKYRKVVDKYNSEWHVNKYVDILYDICVIGLMVYAGFLGIVSIYAVTMFAQHMFKELITSPAVTSESIVSQYDESILDRMGIEEEEGW